MVAPNGARRDRSHHPDIPLTDDALIDTVQACKLAGAEGAHLHIRDNSGKHTIDAARYRTLLDRLKPLVPDMYLQVTSESAGLYEAAQQQDMMHVLKPRYVSVALREMVRIPEDWKSASTFYRWAASNNVQIQHIVYSPEELQQLLIAIDKGDIPGTAHLLQFVLGSYDGTQISQPNQVERYTKLLETTPLGHNDRHSFDWMLCAFGKEETSCLVETINAGGKARIGFENSLYHSDGSVARNNAERVEELVSRL